MSTWYYWFATLKKPKILVMDSSERFSNSHGDRIALNPDFWKFMEKNTELWINSIICWKYSMTTCFENVVKALWMKQSIYKQFRPCHWIIHIPLLNDHIIRETSEATPHTLIYFCEFTSCSKLETEFWTSPWKDSHRCNGDISQD